MKNGTVSSIGIIGAPYYDNWNNRIKGFCPKVIELGNIGDAAEFIQEARSLKRNVSATRITLRMVVSKGLKIAGMHEEARIQLNGDWKEYEIIYLGENDSRRMVSPAILIAEDKLLESVVKQSKRYSNVLQRIKQEGFKVSIGAIAPPDISQICNLYQEAFSDNKGKFKYTFALTEKTLETILPTATVVTARNCQREIVSILMGEVAEIPTDKGKLKICEYSDEATLRLYRGKGLSQACLRVLIQELSEDIDVIYGEARASHVGANVVPVKAGFAYGGRLIKNCVIGGDKEVKEKGRYENLNVWYFNV